MKIFLLHQPHKTKKLAYLILSGVLIPLLFTLIFACQSAKPIPIPADILDQHVKAGNKLLIPFDSASAVPTNTPTPAPTPTPTPTPTPVTVILTTTRNSSPGTYGSECRQGNASCIGDVADHNQCAFGKPGSPYDIGSHGCAIKFENVPADLTSGAIISSATLKVFSCVSGTCAFGSSQVTGRFKMQRSATPADITYCINACASISNRTFTSIVINANHNGSSGQGNFPSFAGNNQPQTFTQNFGPMLQEVIDNHSTGGNSIFLWWEATNNPSSNTARVAAMPGSGSAPTLTVVYTPS